MKTKDLSNALFTSSYEGSVMQRPLTFRLRSFR